MASNTFIHKHYEKVILAGLLLLFSGLLYLQLAVVKESQAKKVDDIVNAPEPPADFQKADYTAEKYSKEVLFDEKSLEWKSLWEGKKNPLGASEDTVNIDMMVPMKMALCKHGNHLIAASLYPKKGSTSTGMCDYCPNDNGKGGILEAPKNDVAQTLEEDPVDNDINKNGIPDEWERKHNLPVEEVRDGDVINVADTDGDGFNDLEEYRSGTGPRDPGSHPLLVTKLVLDSEKQVEAIPFEDFINGILAGVKEVGEVTDFKLEKCEGGNAIFYCKRVANGRLFRMKRCKVGKEILYKNSGSTGKQPSIGFRVEEIGAEIVTVKGKGGKETSERKSVVKIVSVTNPQEVFICKEDEVIETGYKRIFLESLVEQKKLSIKIKISADGVTGDKIVLGSDTLGEEEYTVSELKETEQGMVLVLKDAKGKAYEVKANASSQESEETPESAK